MRSILLVLLFGFAGGFSVENSREVEEMVTYFDELEGGINSPKQAKKFIESYICSLEKEHNIKIDRQQVVEMVIKEIEKQDMPKESKEKLTGFFGSLLDKKIYLALCTGYFKGKEQTNLEAEIPSDLIIGGIEIFTGVLLCILPGCKTIGSAVVLDGVRRIMDGVKQIDDSDKISNEDKSGMEKSKIVERKCDSNLPLFPSILPPIFYLIK